MIHVVLLLRFPENCSAIEKIWDFFFSLTSFRGTFQETIVSRCPSSRVSFLEMVYVCDECGVEFPSQGKLDDHSSSHRSDRPFVCNHPGCGASFKRKRELDTHTSCVHVGARPYKCTVPGCTAAYFTTSNLAKHKKMHETKIVCPHDGCGEVFHKKSQLRAHLGSVHTGDPSRPYSCGSCSRCFAFPSQLERHQAAHVATEHVCGYDGCGHIFATASELRDHMREEHAPAEPGRVSCPKCSKMLHPASLRAHLLTHEPVDQQQSFVCQVPGCGKQYASKKSLRAHFNASHSDHRFVCPTCQASFAYKVSLVKHEARVHAAAAAASTEPSQAQDGGDTDAEDDGGAVVAAPVRRESPAVNAVAEQVAGISFVQSEEMLSLGAFLAHEQSVATTATSI